MLLEPRCSERRCRHFDGPFQTKASDKEDGNIIMVCPAFPDGIPDEIAYGDNLHRSVVPGQTGTLVFERK